MTSDNYLYDVDEGNATTVNTSAMSPVCAYSEPYDFTRFLIIVSVGMPFATVGLIANLILFSRFIQPKYRNSPTLYLSVLAVLDFAICGMYLLIFVVDAFVMYLHILPLLYVIWHRYAMALFALSRIVQLASTYLIICVSAERFCLVADIKCCKMMYSINGRRIVIMCIFLMAIGLRLVSYWEYSVIQYQHCTQPFKTLDFYPLLARSYEYSVTYSFFVMQIIQVFVPFILLLILNIAIISTVRKRFIGSKERRNPEMTDVNLSMAMTSASYKYRLKTATYTTVAIVTSYLCCNSFDLLVKTLEQMDNVRTDDANKVLTFVDESGMIDSTRFYDLSTDVISILFTINSFLRPFICVACDRQLRADLVQMVRRQRTRDILQNGATQQNNTNNVCEMSPVAPAAAGLLASVTESMSKKLGEKFRAASLRQVDGRERNGLRAMYSMPHSNQRSPTGDDQCRFALIHEKPASDDGDTNALAVGDVSPTNYANNSVDTHLLHVQFTAHTVEEYL